MKERNVSTCSVIIVTYNSEKFIFKCMQALLKQKLLPLEILIVDTGSKDLNYLKAFEQHSNVKIYFAERDSGFCRGNNVGFQKVDPKAKYILLLNPDAFLGENFLEGAIEFMEKQENRLCGALTGKLLGFDIHKDAPTHLYDSTGIFCTWFGKWYDRAQGTSIALSPSYDQPEQVPALCGALYFCRKSALEAVVLKDQAIFDPSFYMYKEDIDLSLRLKGKGWQLFFVPSLFAYHCRGWNPCRQAMPKALRLYSARNELKVHRRLFRPIPILYSMCKYLAVKYLNA